MTKRCLLWTRLLFLVTLFFGIVACGQKGPLVPAKKVLSAEPGIVYIDNTLRNNSHYVYI